MSEFVQANVWDPRSQDPIIVLPFHIRVSQGFRIASELILIVSSRRSRYIIPKILDIIHCVPPP